MGYYVRALPAKKTNPKWKLQFVSYKNDDIKDSTANKPKKEWDIDKNRWRALGFHNLMTIDEAKIRARQLNKQRFVKEQEKRIQILEQQKKAQTKRYDSFLPEEFVAEFENRFLRVRKERLKKFSQRKSRAYGIWRAAQKMIVAVQVEPSNWLYHTLEVYDYFHQQRFSLRYAYAILKIANLWGFFISRKLGQPFLPVPLPRGYERMRLIEANYEKEQASVARASKPLLPQQLESVAEKLNRLNFNWLHLSIWFGLRPQELDNLKNKDLWQIELLPTGRKVLWVYQTKIIALPREDRWKPIPILFDQQEFGLKMIEAGNFRRPLLKTMRKHFGLGICLYGGRKGFTDLMLSKGHSLENISVWMGHSTLDRTWRSYKSRTKFHFAG